MPQTTLINLRSNEYSQELHFYPFTAGLGRCAGILLMTYLTEYVFQMKQKI